MLKRCFKISLKVLLALFVVLFLLLTFERVRGLISLARYKNELAARGETLDVQKLVNPSVAEADNGAAEFLTLTNSMKEGKVLTINSPPKMKIIASGKAMGGFRENFWVDDKVTNTWNEVAADLKTNHETLERLKVILTKPAFDFKLNHSNGFKMMLPQLALAKSFCQWLGPAVQNSLRAGNNPAALKYLLATINLPRVLENDHTVISELVRIAISSINLGSTWEALQADGWTDDQLALIQRAWEKNTFVTNAVNSLRMERADGDTCFALFQKSNDETYDYMFPSWLASLNGGDDAETSHWWQNELFRKHIYCRIWRFAWMFQDEKFYLEGLQQLIDDKRTGSEKVTPRMEEFWFGLTKAPRQNFYNRWRFGMSAQSLATLTGATAKSARAETDRSMVLCAIALKRYSLRHGKTAPDLNALVPEFLPSVPTDYMDGKPMKYRLNADGTWLLYSVGDDGQDDGGDSSPANPEQKYRWIWRCKDAVWPSPASQEEIETWRKSAAMN